MLCARINPSFPFFVVSSSKNRKRYEKEECKTKDSGCMRVSVFGPADPAETIGRERIDSRPVSRFLQLVAKVPGK